MCPVADQQAETNYDGGCTCGNVRFRMASTPLYVHCCHCRWCQRETGAAFALNALVESDRVRIVSGRPEVTSMHTESSKGQAIWRCPDCRVALWSHYAGFGDKVSFVRVGTLDQADRLLPDIHIFTESKQPWVIIPAEHASVERYYDLKQHWPDSSRARLRRLLSGSVS